MAWWWPFKKKPKKEPLEQWLDDYDNWLETIQVVFQKFPDHSGLEGVRLSHEEGVVLDEITQLYGDEACHVVERMVLKSAQLRRTRRLLGSGR